MHFNGNLAVNFAVNQFVQLYKMFGINVFCKVHLGAATGSQRCFKLPAANNRRLRACPAKIRQAERRRTDCRRTDKF